MRTWLGWITLASLLVACDGGEDPDGGLGLDAGAGLDAGDDDAGEPGCDAGADPFACEDLTPDPSCPASWVVGLTGTVQAADGTPIAGARTQACLRLHPDESLVCLPPPATDADGRFAIVVPESLRCLSRAVMRVLAPSQPFAATYCPIAFPSAVEPIHAIAEPYVLHPVTAATAPPAGDRAAPRDVSFDGDLVLRLAPDSLSLSGDYDGLAGAAVDPAATTCFARGESFDGAFVFSPESGIEGGAEVSFPNAGGLAPGAEVELFVLGGLETILADGSTLEEAELASLGVATVSGDGARVEGGAARLPYLSWLVYRAR